jgi:hypothetical protein
MPPLQKDSNLVRKYDESLAKKKVNKRDYGTPWCYQAIELLPSVQEL